MPEQILIQLNNNNKIYDGIKIGSGAAHSFVIAKIR